MAFNASQLRNNLTNVRPATGNMYVVELDAPSILKGSNKNLLLTVPSTIDWSTILSDIQFRCQSIELPGKQIETIKRDTVGPGRDIPSGNTFGIINLSLLEGKDYNIRKLFDAWQEGIHSQNAANTYHVPYYDEIIANQMRLKIYSPDGTIQRIYTFHDVYPRSVGSDQLSWSNRDQFVVIPIEMTYHRWSVTINTTEAELGQASLQDSLVNDLISSATGSGNSLTDLLPDSLQDVFNNIKDTVATTSASVTGLIPPGIQDLVSKAAPQLTANLIPSFSDIIDSRGDLKNLANSKLKALTSNANAAGQDIVRQSAIAGLESVRGTPLGDLIVPSNELSQLAVTKYTESLGKKLTSLF